MKKHLILYILVVFSTLLNGNICLGADSLEVKTETNQSSKKIFVSEQDALELLNLVQTKKDFTDAIALFEGASNFKDLKRNKKLTEMVLSHSDSFSMENPVWAESLWGIIIMAFGFGFAALLTPCVFPLIPMTVTFFMKDGKGKGIRNALMYGVSIVLIYTLLGFGVAALTSDATVISNLSTNGVVNLIFFAIFMVFAASFLGMFEITLPSWLVNRMDKQADKGGFLGPFFMAFTLVLVSFSCTGPIVSSVLVEAVEGQFVKPIVAMLAFGSAIALPFTLFAIFPDWLSNLPKSGGWLNSVKVVLGFVEIALGLKFLSMVDLVYGWGILDREIYLSLWIAIFSFISLYLLGKFKLPNDSDMDRIGVPRLMLSMVSMAFVIYMIPGLWGAPLKELTGYLPPMSTQDDYHNTEAIVRSVVTEITEDLEGTGKKKGVSANKLCSPNPKYSDKLHLPHQLKGYFEINEALQCAKEQNKPLFVDFTGHACVNCRKMEEEVWKDPKVYSRLRKDYIMVALYCDDRKVKLTEDEWVQSKDGTEMLKNVGDINKDYQINEFNSNQQPRYVLMDWEGNKLVPTRAFNLNIDEFVDFLDEGKATFDQKYGAKSDKEKASSPEESN